MVRRDGAPGIRGGGLDHFSEEVTFRSRGEGSGAGDVKRAGRMFWVLCAPVYRGAPSLFLLAVEANFRASEPR